MAHLPRRLGGLAEKIGWALSNLTRVLRRRENLGMEKTKKTRCGHREKAASHLQTMKKPNVLTP